MTSDAALCWRRNWIRSVCPAVYHCANSAEHGAAQPDASSTSDSEIAEPNTRAITSGSSWASAGPMVSAHLAHSASTGAGEPRKNRVRRTPTAQSQPRRTHDRVSTGLACVGLMPPKVSEDTTESPCSTIRGGPGARTAGARWVRPFGWALIVATENEIAGEVARGTKVRPITIAVADNHTAARAGVGRRMRRRAGPSMPRCSSAPKEIEPAAMTTNRRVPVRPCEPSGRKTTSGQWAR